MARYLLLTFTFLLVGFAAFAQAKLEGTVKDADSGEPIVFGTVAIFQNGVLITGTETDFEGYYSITEIDAGTYDVEFSTTGYNPQRVTGMAITSGRANKLDMKLSAGVVLDVVEVIYTRPVIEQDNTTQGVSMTADQIKALPTRNVNAMASMSAGVSSADEGSALSMRGSRSDATNYYIDGIRVQGNLPPKQAIEELSVITGGVEARYGDVTGGIVSITTKGPSESFSGGVELESSRLTDAYYQDLASLQLSGPILKKGDRTLLGYRINGQYQYNKDDDPPATPVYSIKDDVRQLLEANPIRVAEGTIYPEAQYVDNSGVNKLKFKPNEERTTIDLNGKLDANIGKNVDVTLSGTYYNINDKFTPGNNSEWRVFNSHNNPTRETSRLRGNFRLRHRLGGANTAAGKEEGKGSVIQNAVYVLQFGYERAKDREADPRHGDNLFNYGYIGNYDMSWEPTLQPNTITIGDSLLINTTEHVDYSRTLNGYTPNLDINPVLTRYIPNAGSDYDDFADFQVRNGFIPNTLSNVWADHHTNIGTVYNLNRKRDLDLYTFNANTSFELVPGGSGGNRHSIQFGILYEQTIQRGYDVRPVGLWNTARLHANEHIEGQGLDSTQQVGTLPGTRFTQNLLTGEQTTEDIDVPIYAPNITSGSSDNLFFSRVRQALGLPINSYVNVDGLDPSQLSLDMFSARELNDDNLLSYWGYDYLGNQIDGVTFEDFFTATEVVNGREIRTFPIAAFEPNYQAAYIQDKFKFKDVFFRVGLRVDRYDANTKVLKDPYSLYDVMTASDFHNSFGGERPGNIGDDYKVYVTSEGGDVVKAYRNEDTWYFANGAPANDGTEIFGGTIVYPRYAEGEQSKRDVTSKNFDPDISFEDYTPQVNWMPRLAFSFPISDEANFFANYDVLVQRPPGNSLVTPRTYFYWEQNGSALRSNSNLKPERTVTYEVGFQQRVGANSALKLSAYYKELRDMIQSRFFLNVPAPVNQYETFDNLDFATVKAFTVSYDLRRTGNVQMNLAYTLQFADGTGSDNESSRNLGSRGIQRSLFPMSYDERHRINIIFDYRYASGKLYNGPRIGGLDILANTGLNILATTVSGRPYTAAIQPEPFGSSGIRGAINGSRLPWNTLVNLQVDKQFNLSKEGAKRSIGMNLYVRVSNLFDRRNIQDVYKFSGEPDDDGFLESARGELLLANATNSSQSFPAYLASYQWRMLNPDNFSLPRRIFLGAIFDF